VLIGNIFVILSSTVSKMTLCYVIYIAKILKKLIIYSHLVIIYS